MATRGISERRRPHDSGSPIQARPEGQRDRGGRLLVALFLCAISLPLSANLVGVDGADPGAENRELAAFPRVDGTWKSLAAFPAGFSLWFDDHFGFRSILVRWYGDRKSVV